MAIQIDGLAVTERADTYTAYELDFKRENSRICGTLFLPNGADTAARPTVVIAHGFSSSRATTAGSAAHLAAAGIAAYVFDFCGGGPASASDGSTLDMTVWTELADMNAVLDGLRACDFVDVGNVFLMGKSQGGFVAAMLAARRPQDCRGLVLYYPALVIPDDARRRCEELGGVPERVRIMNMEVGRDYNASVLETDPYEEIGAYPGDVLIVHGTADTIVPISYSERAVEAYGHAELLVLDGAGHGFTGAGFDAATAATIEFIRERA